MFCITCGKELPEGTNTCSYCNHQSSQPVKKNNHRQKFYKRYWFIWLMLIFIAPVGIILMWFQKKFHPVLRVFLSAIFLIWFIVWMQPDKNPEIEIINQSSTTEKEKPGQVKKIAAPTPTADEYKANCIILSYDEIARNPEKHKGQKLFLTGKIVQVVESGNNLDLRVCVTLGEYDLWDNVVWVNYTRPKSEGRLLENDIIEFWGDFKGIKKYGSILGSEVSVPEVNAKIITLKK